MKGGLSFQELMVKGPGTCLRRGSLKLKLIGAEGIINLSTNSTSTDPKQHGQKYMG